jgi:hypothetical protein
VKMKQVVEFYCRRDHFTDVALVKQKVFHKKVFNEVRQAYPFYVVCRNILLIFRDGQAFFIKKSVNLQYLSQILKFIQNTAQLCLSQRVLKVVY